MTTTTTTTPPSPHRNSNHITKHGWIGPFSMYPVVLRIALEKRLGLVFDGDIRRASIRFFSGQWRVVGTRVRAVAS
jgi:hypothetical protein